MTDIKYRRLRVRKRITGFLEKENQQMFSLREQNKYKNLFYEKKIYDKKKRQNYKLLYSSVMWAKTIDLWGKKQILSGNMVSLTVF